VPFIVKDALVIIGLAALVWAGWTIHRSVGVAVFGLELIIIGVRARPSRRGER